MITGMAHGLAVGMYAILSVVGLAAVIHNLPGVFTAIQWGGALFLAWIGLQGLRPKTVIVTTKVDHHKKPHAARDGFLMACLNPKAIIFFVALFSQVVDPNTPLLAKLGYALTAMLVDMGWYMTVAWLFSRPRWLAWLQRYSHWLERAFGVILIALAAKIVIAA